jgi:hypothetical protein
MCFYRPHGPLARLPPAFVLSAHDAMNMKHQSFTTPPHHHRPIIIASSPFAIPQITLWITAPTLEQYSTLLDERPRHATRAYLIPAASERGRPSRAITNTQHTTRLPTTHPSPTCLSPCHRPRPSRLPRLRSTSSSTHLHSNHHSSNLRSSSTHNTLHRSTSIPSNSHRLRTHRPTLLLLQQSDNGCRQTLDHRRRPIRTEATMRLHPTCLVAAAMATHMRLLPHTRNRRIRPTTSPHRRNIPSTHHSPTRRNKSPGNLRQTRLRLRCNVRSSRVLDHHSRTVK